MIALRFLDDPAEPSLSGHTYRIAATFVAANRLIPMLGPFSAPLPLHLTGAALNWDRRLHFEDAPRTLVYQGQGWLCNAWREVTTWRTPAGYRLSVDGIAGFGIRADGARIDELAADAQASPPQRDEVALGPALILALALHGQWALHAAAVLRNEGVVAFLGDSGAGKSTLAHYLHNPGNHGLVRIADDILPFTAAKDGIDALPHFLQLKLPLEQWPAPDLPIRVKLRAAYIINAQRENVKHVSITPLTGRQASLALMRHTVAAKLFGPVLLAQHMSICARVAEELPVRLLSYPLEISVLPRVRNAILADVTSLAAP